MFKNPDRHMCYLCGSMESAKDGGKTWREEITPVLHSIGYSVFNPCLSEADRLGLSSDEIQQALTKCKKSKDWQNFQMIMDEIQKSDIEAIESSDFLIMMLNHKSGPGGTYQEQIYASLHKKPTLGICVGDINDENSWMMNSVLNSGRIFYTVDAIERFLNYQLLVWGYSWPKYFDTNKGNVFNFLGKTEE
jgi:hypothetical protein